MGQSTTSSGTTQDSSVIVSLQELLLLESERLESEKRAERERHLAEKRRVEAEEARRVAEERERMRFLDREKEERLLRERVEAARVEAIRTAELEHQREQLRIQREQERLRGELELIESSARETGRPARAMVSVAFASLGALVLVLLAAGTCFELHARNQRHLARIESEHAAELSAVQAQLRVAKAETRLRPLSVDSLLKTPQTVPAVPAATAKPVQSRPIILERRTPPPRPVCPKGDPMCAEL